MEDNKFTLFAEAKKSYNAVLQIINNICVRLNNAGDDIELDKVHFAFDCLLQSILLKASILDYAKTSEEISFIEELVDFGDVLIVLNTFMEEEANAKNDAYYPIEWEHLKDNDSSLRDIKMISELCEDYISDWTKELIEIVSIFDAYDEENDYLEEICEHLSVIATSFARFDGYTDDEEIQGIVALFLEKIIMPLQIGTLEAEEEKENMV